MFKLLFIFLAVKQLLDKVIWVIDIYSKLIIIRRGKADPVGFPLITQKQ